MCKMTTDTRRHARVDHPVGYEKCDEEAEPDGHGQLWPVLAVFSGAVEHEGMRGGGSNLTIRI